MPLLAGWEFLIFFVVYQTVVVFFNAGLVWVVFAAFIAFLIWRLWRDTRCQSAIAEEHRYIPMPPT